MRTSDLLAVVAAMVPIALAITCDPEARPFGGEGRAVVLGLTLAGDRSFAAPIGQLLAPIATLFPVGSIELRAAIALSLPAALATWLVARRISAMSWAAGRWTSAAIVLAFGAMAGVLLGAAPPEAALAALGIELAIARTRPAFGGSAMASIRERRFALLAAAMLPVALWAAPRLSPAVIVAVAYALPTLRQRPLRLAVAALSVLVPAILLLFVRDSTAWLATGNVFVAPSFLRAHDALDSAALRAIVATALLATIARWVARAPTLDERATFACGATALGCAWLLGAGGGALIMGAIVAPLAAAAAGALSLAVDKRVADAASRGGERLARRALSALVPALALGLAARAFEVQMGARRLPISAESAHDVGGLLTIGITAPRGVLLLEEEPMLLAWARDRVLHGLRPDVRVLPTQALLSGGAAHLATRTVANVPGATEVLRALLAHGALDVADVAPLAEKATVLGELPASRVHAIARHASPSGGPLSFALERVDPSDRRLRRPAIDRRLAFLAASLSSRPPEDRLRRLLRVDATREARVLAAAGDRDAALAAIARATSFGAPESRALRWSARVSSKQTLDAEPSTDDD